jgi:hypothetical protein
MGVHLVPVGESTVKMTCQRTFAVTRNTDGSPAAKAAMPC